MEETTAMFDAVIVGARPAGLSAALMLGRMRLPTLVCDTSAPRNATTHAAHGVFTRDGTPPSELRRIGRDQLQPYDTVEIRPVGVLAARIVEGVFEATLADGATVLTKRLLLASGMIDDLPEV